MTTVRIPTRSKRQAMDWSLALISQGVASTIEHSTEEGWALTVAEQDSRRATAILEQYRSEETRWRWRQRLRHELVFDWGSLAWVGLISIFFWLGEAGVDLRSAGLMDGDAVSSGEWWRLFTAVLLHADAAHLATNATIGLVLLGLAMGRYGTGIGLLAGYIAGAGGNICSWITFDHHRSLGASGMVMGCLGLIALPPAFPGAVRSALKHAVTGVVAGVMLFILLGLNPATDVMAHLGGFMSGLFFAGLLQRGGRKLNQQSGLNATCGLLFALLVITTWICALRV